MGGSSSDVEDEWKPNYNQAHAHKLNKYLPSKRKKIKKEDSANGSIEEFGGWKSNGCPVCHKCFSRSAALICHIKQNHSYMLKKTDRDCTIQSMERDILEWKNRMNKNNSDSKEASHNTRRSIKTDNIHSNGASSDDSVGANNHEDLSEEVDSKFPIIGGTAASTDEEQPTNGLLSILAFESANSELLDPDQSFAIVRGNVKKGAKPKSSEALHKSKIDFKGPVKSTKQTIVTNKNMSDFEKVDFSIDDSDESQKVLECFVCRQCFSSPSLLTYHHMRKHMTDEIRQCQQCGSVFYDVSLYSAHVKLHDKS